MDGSWVTRAVVLKKVGSWLTRDPDDAPTREEGVREKRLREEARRENAEPETGGGSKRVLVATEEFICPPKSYQIVSRLGAGGAGDVYVAIDGDLGRGVALKVLSRASPKSRARFQNEAHIGAHLEHPNICPVYNVGFTAAGAPFIAMKRIRGRSLAQVIEALCCGDPETVQVFPLARRVDVLIQAAQGLAYAHEKGVIHRDLKPANIMVGSHGEVFVMDWGLAKATGDLDASGSDDRPTPGVRRGTEPVSIEELNACLTVEGHLLGTPCLYLRHPCCRVGGGQVGTAETGGMRGTVDQTAPAVLSAMLPDLRRLPPIRSNYAR